MSIYTDLISQLRASPRRWLVTGVAGFIGSNLLGTLLDAGQTVRGLDNFSTGKTKNLDQVRKSVGENNWKNFDMVEADICDTETCLSSAKDVDFILHQAALGSVPRSIKNPLVTHNSNVNGFLNMLNAAEQMKVSRFVYAASSSTYGDSPHLPKKEDVIGKPLSPYAVTKLVNELYAEVYGLTYGTPTIGLRYFNVFGQRQDPDGAYAAVIPKWFKASLLNQPVYINGDGETSRDFSFIENVVQANILAACVSDEAAVGQVYNVAYGEATSLNELFGLIRDLVGSSSEVVYQDFRLGDVRHSLADISKARTLLGYDPQYSVTEGLRKAASWYKANLGAEA